MPVTPFHWSVLIFGLLFSSIFYIPALIISSSIMDLEPFYFYFISPPANGIVHGFFHTYLGASIIAIATAFVLIKLKPFIDKLMKKFGLEQKNIPDKLIYFSSFFGAYSHIFIDSFMHSDMKPFFPLTDSNHFLGVLSSFQIYEITGIGLLIVLILYSAKLLKK